MSEYCYVQNNAVVSGPQFLPTRWTDPNTGQQYSNLTALSDQELIEIGWYPYVENDTGRPGFYYTAQYSDFVINADNVSRTVTWVQWDIEDVRADKNTQLEAYLQESEYTITDQALNEKVNEYIRNDAEWVAEKQGELARLTDWDEVANFDTTKPDVLTLKNSFVGASYVRQGLGLTEKNQASVSAGQGEIWDQVEINTFVAENRTAAEDSSDATAPRKPGYRIRQPIANVSEQFNRVVIYRFDVDDQNPALRRSYAMQLKNRQDDRNLYIFSYTNGTYLTWRLFELQSDGVTWYLEATPAERQYVDTDMNFIFSYGTNPAVEADYFTDRVSFPAGVQTKNILVAWDPV